MLNRYFADLSSNNPAFDAVAYRAAGHRLVAIKATQGTSYVNPKHALWCEHAHANQLAVIHYHYAKPGSSVAATTQAAFAWSVVRHDFGPLDWMCLDVERDQAWRTGELVPFVSSFAAAWRGISGHSLVGYSEASLLDDPALVAAIPGERWWAAAWGPTRPRIATVGAPWAWQFTDGAIGPPPHECAGVGYCDVSQLNLATYLHLLARLASQR